MNDDTERVLVRKLVEQLHLSVAERRSLPEGRARLSLVVDSIAAIIQEVGGFPSGADPLGPFDGAMVIVDDAGLAVRWRYEIGLGR